MRFSEMLYDKQRPKKVKSDELEKLKECDNLVDEYNSHSHFFYKLKLLKSVKRAWF
jgi:hypothetical protein